MDVEKLEVQDKSKVCKRDIGLDKSGYQVNIFLISPQKHMLWSSLEAPRRASARRF